MEGGKFPIDSGSFPKSELPQKEREFFKKYEESKDSKRTIASRCYGSQLIAIMEYGVPTVKVRHTIQNGDSRKVVSVKNLPSLEIAKSRLERFEKVSQKLLAV